MKLMFASLVLVVVLVNSGCSSVMVRQKTCKPDHMEMNGDVISECSKV